MPQAHDTAKATAEAYVRQQQALSRGLVKLPRVVQGECNSKEPHYLMYLTKEEIAHVLAMTANKPTGHMHPQKVLCAPPDTTPPTSPRTKRIKVTNIESIHPQQRVYRPPAAFYEREDYEKALDVDPELRTRILRNVDRLLALHSELGIKKGFGPIDARRYTDLVYTHTNKAYERARHIIRPEDQIDAIDAYFAEQFDYVEEELRKH